MPTEEQTREKIREVIDHYKADFPKVDERERYKWLAIGWFKQHWNTDAADFPAMAKAAFAKTDNLLIAPGSYPCNQLQEYGKENPEGLKQLFQTLYNEDIPLFTRWETFRNAFTDYYAPQGKRSKQDLHALSVYLTFYRPDIAWDNYGQEITDRTVFTSGGKTVLNAFINTMQIGDIVFSCYTATLIDAIGVVTGSYEWHEEYPELKRLRKVHWIVKGIREDIFERNGNTAMTLSSVYRLSNISLSDVYQILQKYNCAPAALQVSQDSDNYVFIIDEINRGNISKIFGELITLIEPNKRKGQSEEAAVLLPNSQKLFGVPKNVYLIGTMNTADRSIAAIDTALHRRFSEVEMMPDPTVLKGVCVEDVAIDRMLDRLNQKIIALYDRDHTLGHAYFMPLKKDPTVKTLERVFRSSILPLLQEYFYDDYEKIRKVLGDNRKQDEETQFILAKPIEYQDLFGEDCSEDTPVCYEVNEAAFENIDAYRMI